MVILLLLKKWHKSLVAFPISNPEYPPQWGAVLPMGGSAPLNVKNAELLFLKGNLPKNAGQIIKEFLSDNIVTSKFKSCVTLKKDESEELL